MSRALRKTPAFMADFESLFAWYLDQAGEKVAWRFQTALDNSLGKLSVRPDLGRLRLFRHNALTGLRSFPVERPFENLLIFYRANNDVLDVIRVMHGARDLPRRLRESPTADD